MFDFFSTTRYLLFILFVFVTAVVAVLLYALFYLLNPQPDYYRTHTTQRMPHHSSLPSFLFLWILPSTILYSFSLSAPHRLSNTIHYPLSIDNTHNSSSLQVCLSANHSKPTWIQSLEYNLLLPPNKHIPHLLLLSGHHNAWKSFLDKQLRTFDLTFQWIEGVHPDDLNLRIQS